MPLRAREPLGLLVFDRPPQRRRLETAFRASTGTTAAWSSPASLSPATQSSSTTATSTTPVLADADPGVGEPPGFAERRASGQGSGAGSLEGKPCAGAPSATGALAPDASARGRDGEVERRRSEKERRTSSSVAYRPTADLVVNVRNYEVGSGLV